MSQIRVAVVGGGRLGTIHARLLDKVPDAELVALVEPNAEQATALAEQFDCPVLTDLERLLNDGQVDAAVVAAPTTLHHRIGLRLLNSGIHVLMEKPLAPTNVECEQLVAAAAHADRVLQVGHVERFNPVWTALQTRIGFPRFIQATREAPLTLRSMDVGVVLDLMVHDIDLIVSLLRVPVVAVQAVGSSWTGPKEDVAQARLTFANGCVANLNASRVASDAKRQMTIYGTDWYGQIDFGDRTGVVVHGPEQKDWQTRSLTPEQRMELAQNVFSEVLSREPIEPPENNAILDELTDFVASIKTNSLPTVSGKHGLEVVEIANQIVQRIEQHATTMPVYAPTLRKVG